MQRRTLRLFWCACACLASLAACSSDPIGTGGASGSSSSGGGGATSTTISTTSTGSTISTGGGEPLPDVFTVTGVVVDALDGATPIEGAIVMQAGGEPALTTGPDGTFSIELSKAIPGTPTVVATKLGFRTKGMDFFELPGGPIKLAILAAKPPDNEGYTYGPPGTGEQINNESTAFCDHCHTTFVKQFWSTAHSKATKDPLVQDLYAGVTEAASTAAACAAMGGEFREGLVPGTAGDVASKCYLDGGVLPDLNPACGAPGEMACDDPALPAAKKPTAFGRCADCHAPGIDGKAGGRSLHEAVGLAFDAGNHCDPCHHVSDVDLTKPPGVGGALVLQRPHEKQSDLPTAKPVQVMYGPLLDVPNEFMGGSYQPKFRDAELCAGCHQQRQEALLPGQSLDPGRWPEGLPIHDTYGEWKGSGWGTPATPCQFCHMPPDDTGLKSTCEVVNEETASIVYGFVRPPDQIRKHTFRSPLDGSPRFIDTAITFGVSLSQDVGPGGVPVVKAQVNVQNVLAGHAIPTGEPMRSLVLVVRADGCGQPWAALDGGTIQDGGGSFARGVAGAGVQVNGASLAWPEGAAAAKAGMRVRVVRPTGAFDDYAGIGFFADPSLTPAEKGLPVLVPVGEATVTGVAGSDVQVDAAIAVQAGDVVYLGDPVPAALADGGAALSLAGAAGYTFAKTLVDAAGSRHVPHYRAIDIASDNRIPPQGARTTSHAFAIPAGCASGTVRASLLYRPAPADMARRRGWDAKDWVVGEATENITVM